MAARYGRSAAMIGWDSSWPWNFYGLIGFIIALAFIILYAFYRSRKDNKEKEERDERLALLISQAVTDGVKKAITELKEAGKL
jgi:membrane protein implicated in regulation of membrane protease activity